MMWWKKGLKKAHDELKQGLARLFQCGTSDAIADLEGMEELLLKADLGPSTVIPLMERIRGQAHRGADLPRFAALLEKELLETMRNGNRGLAKAAAGPTVIFLVGVNGAGKTTTAAKLARLLQKRGESVLLAACDTFRAAARDQLALWGDRLEIDVIGSGGDADAAATAFDAAKAARARGAGYLICDTAGRLHTKTPLLEELKKIKRVVEREIPGAPHETLLVADATTGQNGLVQAKKFHEAVPVTGIVAAKLDGTARGGILVAIERDLKIPVKFVGVGEGMDDFGVFSPEEYVKGLFEE